jgi:hypothetical protein
VARVGSAERVATGSVSVAEVGSSVT